MPILLSIFAALLCTDSTSGWSVESNSAAYLSSGIFKKAMNEDINFSTALQNTINEMIDKNLHPLMWAPFILVGDI